MLRRVPVAAPEQSAVESLPRPNGIWLIAASAFLIFAVRLAAPEDLADNYHQERQAAYVLDILKNGHWICQRDPYGDIASKPPMHAWSSALASLAMSGRLTWFTLVLPGALAATGTALLLFHFGRKYFGGLAGFFAALFFLFSSVGVRQMVQGRIDGLFAFTIAAMALAAFSAWISGRGWPWVWLLAAVSTLTKGPLGVLLGGSGLVAAIWERRSGSPRPIRGALWPGIVLWFVISAGWAALAYWQFGQPMIDKVLGKELVGHVVTGRSGTKFLLQEGYMPAVNFLSRFAPWSLLTCVALWRVWKRPTVDNSSRAFERFLCCWFLAGLVIFSLAAHQRPDLIYPLVPPAALLAGAELNRRLPAAHWRSATQAAYALVILGIVAVGVQYHWLRRDNRAVRRTAVMRSFADVVKTNVPPDALLVHVNEPFAVQVYLSTMSAYVTIERAAELIREESPVFVIITNPAPLVQKLRTNRVHVVYEAGDRDKVFLLSNRGAASPSGGQ